MVTCQHVGLRARSPHTSSLAFGAGLCPWLGDAAALGDICTHCPARYRIVSDVFKLVEMTPSIFTCALVIFNIS